MNKFFAKIASLTAGLALVAGAGVALASHAEVKGVRAASVTATWDATAQGFSNEQQLGGTNYSFSDSNVTISFAEASGNGHKYYNNGTAIRSYSGNAFTIACSAGNLTSITLSNNQSKEVTANVGTYSSNSWTGNSSSVTFTVESGSGNFRTSTITAVYNSEGGGEEDPVLQSIAVSGEKTVYTVGDEFVKPTVTATYDKGEPQDVTASATCSGYNMGVAGEYEVTVSYGGKTAKYDIIVSAAEPAGEVLYSATFTSVETHSYTQDKEFTLNGKDWVASVSQVNSGVFYLGCNSSNAAKGVLNNNSSFSDVVEALSDADSAYASNVSAAHAYALRFANAYENVGSVEFTWAGGNNAFQVYLFGDRGDGLEVLAHENYATSGTAVAGSVSWHASEYGEDFSSFVIVARPGATASTATSKTLRAATFQIVEGEEEAPIDPELDTLVVLLNDATPSPVSLPYSNGGLWYANDKDGNDIDAEWSSSDTSVFTITENGNHVGVVHPVGPGTANIIAHAEGFNDGVCALTITIGDVEGVEVSGEMSKTSYTTNDSWSPDGFIVTVSYSTGYETVVTEGISWSYNPAAPAENVTSVVATATYGGESGSSSAQVVSVTVSHAGTASDPFTVAEALAKCNEIGAVGNAGQGPWVTTGIITRVTSAPAATYWNATYYISDDGTQNNELQVYRGFYLNNAKFDAETALLMKAGMIVTITGNLTGSYGGEYCANNYLLSIEAPDTGDIDVTFEPSVTSYEIGDTGTFVASSETQGVTFSWGVDKSNVLSVDASTGAFEAVGLGVARVTVTATLNDKEGSTYVDFIVNGKDVISVSEANAIAAGEASGQTTQYYVYVEGYVAEFATSMSGENPRAIDIMDLAGNKIMVYTNTGDRYTNFIDGLALGDYIVVKANVQNYNGTYELTSPVKVSSNYSAVSFAFEILSETDSTCATFVDGESDYGEFQDIFSAVWESLAEKYSALSDKDTLIEADAIETGTVVERAMARYDFLSIKYDLDQFIAGRDIVTRYVPTVTTIADTNSAIAVVAIVAIASISAIAVILVIKRRRAFDR